MLFRSPFPALLKRLVLDPIGMTNSTYEQPLPAALKGREAAGYKSDGSMVVGRWHTYPEMAAAGLWTTPSDLLHWALEIAAAKAGLVYAWADAACSIASARARRGADWRAVLKEAAAPLRERGEGAALNLLKARWAELQGGA